MPEYVCRLGAPDGSVVEQRRVAASLDALRRELESEGFHVFSLAGARSRFRIPLLSRSEKVGGQDFLLFNTQLRTLLHAGMPLAQSLELLKDQQTNPHFGALLEKIEEGYDLVVGDGVLFASTAVNITNNVLQAVEANFQASGAP